MIENEAHMKEITIAITAASYSGNKGSAAMLQSSIQQLKEVYGSGLKIYLMSVYPSEDRIQCPHDFVTIIPAQPQRLLFLAFPCAVFYRLFGWCPPFRALLLKNQILKAYADTDLVVDEAGIAFSDSRNCIFNTYSFVCAAVPILSGAALVKYSQALGPFQHAYNRFLAKWVLPKAEMVIARGRSSYQHLLSIGLKERARFYADGAFTMQLDEETERRVQKACAGFGSETVGFSISSVVAEKCRKAGIDYNRIMVQFLLYLTGHGRQVFMFANAARTGSKKLHNNDLPIGDAVYREYQRLAPVHLKDSLLWEHREMNAEEISAYIAQCSLLVSSRFHAMVFALNRQVPVMLIGWGHKYQEVMEQFGLGAYAVDFSQIDLCGLQECFSLLEQNQSSIRETIAQCLPAVRESSRWNVRSIVQIAERLTEEKQKSRVQTAGKQAVRVRAAGKQLDGRRYMNHVIHLDQPDCYIGPHLYCKMGYAADSSIRANAASGGVVTAFLLNLMKNKEIDGAWAVKTAFTETGELTYHTFIAVTEEQIREASSSVYMNIPMLSHIDQLRKFNGRLAVVLTPCMMHAFCHILERDSSLRRKIVIKIGLFCSGAHSREASEFALDHYNIPRFGAQRLYYRRGHWRGISSVLYENGSQIDFSYTKSICAYKNAYFFAERSCLNCKDQFASDADISFGDVWLAEVKKEPVKYTGCVIRTKKAHAVIRRAQKQKDIRMRPMTDEQMLRSQKRALTFKYRGRCWNHRLAGFLAEKNQRFSKEHPDWLKRVPIRAVYYYMCMIRLLLSW